jgi:hypothetical protein
VLYYIGRVLDGNNSSFFSIGGNFQRLFVVEIFFSSKAILSPNCHSLSERLTKNFICINMNVNMSNMMDSIFLPSVQHWLEEFPVDSLTHPIEMAEVVYKVQKTKFLFI